MYPTIGKFIHYWCIENCQFIWTLYLHLECPLFEVPLSHCRSSSVHPTLIGGSLIDFLSLLRWFFLYEPYNFILEFDFISMKILHVCMFLIGVSITVECLFSIVSYISQLQFLTVLKEYRIIFQMWPFFILMLTASSVANAVSLFFQVRDLWVQHMFVTIQILHCVPSLLLVTHSLMQGTISHT